MMRIAITGCNGQLGRELVRVLGQGREVLGIDLPQHDVTDPGIVETIADWRPDLVVHAAAMTDVDGCARNPDAAFRANALGTRNVALSCQQVGAPMLYVSTNEVFDGTKGDAYLELDEPRPINPYGYSKLAGERYVQMLLDRFYIVRISWLYGGPGKHFVGTMIRLADQVGELKVVTDEIACPTYVQDLAPAIDQLVTLPRPVYGIYHLTNAGACSRFDFAKEILRLSGRGHVPVHPITTAEYVRASRPPLYAPLRNLCGTELGITLRSWQAALEEYLYS